VQERIQREAENNFLRAEAEEMQRVRLKAMQTDKESRIRRYVEGNNVMRVPDVAAGLSSLFARTCACVSSAVGPDEEPGTATPLGALSVQLLSATDLPPAGMLFSSLRAYAVAKMGCQTFQSQRVAGCNPLWNHSFHFDVYSVTKAFSVTVFREGWLEDQPLGTVEMPLLDLNEWSGCPIGRVLQPEDSTNGHCMVLELQAVLEWF